MTTLTDPYIPVAPMRNQESAFLAKMAASRGSQLAIGLQYWDGDYDAAMDLAQLIVDLQPKGMNEQWVFILIGRRDAKQPPRDLVEHLRTKFRTYVSQGTRYEVGHPGGSNSLIHDLFSTAFKLQNSLAPRLEAILSMEADCCPLYPDWLTRLYEEWFASQPCHVLGHYQAQEESGHEHVNGSFIASADLFHRLRLRGCGTTIPWDLKYFSVYRSVSKASNEIFLMYRHPSTTLEELFAPKQRAWAMEPIQPCYIHGIRDDSARRLVRDKYL